MGMFDWIVYQGQEFQTKDTPNQMLDRYEIRDDGTLWVEEYDTEWVDDPDRLPIGGFIKHINVRISSTDYTGPMTFYTSNNNTDTWIQYEAEFVNGQAVKIIMVKGEPLTEWYLKGIKEHEDLHK
jgi:hypothetical protein